MSDSNNFKMRLAEKFVKNEIDFLDENAEFEFACDQCGKCCRNRDDILLSPFDIYHMVRATGKTVAEIISRYGDTYVGEQSHLPIVRLKYREEPDNSTVCYFLGKKDGKYYCRIHDNKPTVCRTYPLGKMSTVKQKDETKPCDPRPKYFLQDESDGGCAGHQRAHREHIKQVLVDWVGGKDKMEFADRYSTVFNKFLNEYSEIIDFDKFVKHEPEYANIFFAAVGYKMYHDYNFDVDDDSFLKQLQNNLDDILWLTRVVMDCPEALTGQETYKEKNGPTQSA